MAFQSQLRLFILKRGSVEDVTIYRLEKGWTLHFSLDASLTGFKVRLFVNHPQDPKDGPNRKKYRELEWMNDSKIKIEHFDCYASTKIVLAGSFNYFFTIDGSGDPLNANGCGYFLVDPVLRIGKMDDRLPMDAICCQSVMPKLLGKFPEWTQRLQVSKESGYNMLHFTPVQELGQSDSGFSIKDQLKVDPRYSVGNIEASTDTLKTVVDMMKEDWEVLSLTDLVLNHTAIESPWLLAHPECAYNLVNSAYLKPAYLFDRLLWNFSLRVAEGSYQDRGLPATIDSEHHFWLIRNILNKEILLKHRFWQFAQCDVASIITQFKKTIISGKRADDRPYGEIELIPDPLCRRLHCSIDLPLAVHHYYTSLASTHKVKHDSHMNQACSSLTSKLEDLNAKAAETMQSHLNTGLDNFMANVRWRFLDEHGLKLGTVSAKTPLMWNYFTLPPGMSSDEGNEEATMTSAKAALCMANNGWVMGDDPMRNFAENGSNVYLRRELIPWGDVAKLRYGNSPDDCPFLWKHMREYSIEMARLFHGIRLDNCHSTPIHVAEFMLDEARKVRPDLYVIAELFTNSEYADNTFINRLGINSLIREGLNGHSARELGRLVHRYGGVPVGSFIQPPMRVMVPSRAHALFLDQSHDNESVIQKHTTEDLLAFSAIIAMTCCATGSNRGYDEMVPHYIDVVKENRLYKSWRRDTPSEAHVDTSSALIEAKLLLNQLHVLLAKNGFKEVFVDMINDDVISITRHNPVSHQSLVLFAHTSFSSNQRSGVFTNLSIPGVVEEVVLEGGLRRTLKTEFRKSDVFINGLEDFKVELRRSIKASKSAIFDFEARQGDNVINFHSLDPGAIVILKVQLPEEARSDVLHCRQLMSFFGFQMKSLSSRKVSLKANELDELFDEMSLEGLNRVLYRTDNEEKDDGLGFGAYHIHGHGTLPYCGLQGFMTVLEQIRSFNNLGHPLCKNLREGDWMMDYMCNRLICHPSTQRLGEWIRRAFAPLKKLPRYLVPLYFEAIVHGVYSLAVENCWSKMSPFVGEGSKLVRELSLGSVQMVSYVATSKLNQLSNNLTPPRPPVIEGTVACSSLCAGFPHFSSGLFRNWGRDTFIALKGLLLLTGRQQEARLIILAYAGCLRHGLIPNLLGEGVSARYNSRDSVWFWLQSIKDYCLEFPSGMSILQDRVLRLYPTDDAPVTYDVEESLSQTMQEALQKHAEGLEFRERRAGVDIDAQMRDEGFNVCIGVDWKTGFVYGGNKWNCGTWMDKMGSSEAAGNKGVPATPRDGSAVEIVALSASVVRWLHHVHANGSYPFEGLKDNKGEEHTWSQWYEQISTNFEKHFWVGKNLIKNKQKQEKEKGEEKNDEDEGEETQDYSDADTPHQKNLIHRTDIFKDSVASSHGYTDYQLRCNFPIAIVVCPELFSVEKAWKALQKVEKHLLGPLGMKTLDPNDYNYVGDYHNNDSSTDFKKAQGFNYHQGPEWVWPVGFFLKAKLMMAQRLQQKYCKKEAPNAPPKNPIKKTSKANLEAISYENILEESLVFVEKRLAAHNVHLQQSAWKSLPELTNSDGKHCVDSCEAQAWSVSSLVDVLHHMMTIRT